MEKCKKKSEASFWHMLRGSLFVLILRLICILIESIKEITAGDRESRFLWLLYEVLMMNSIWDKKKLFSHKSINYFNFTNSNLKFKASTKKSSNFQQKSLEVFVSGIKQHLPLPQKNILFIEDFFVPSSARLNSFVFSLFFMPIRARFLNSLQQKLQKLKIFIKNRQLSCFCE